MAEVYNQPIHHPSAWTSAGLGSLEAIKVHWDQRHIDALDEAWREVDRQGLTLDEIEHRHFRLPAIADDLRDIYEEIMRGRGIVLIDRLPVEEWPLTKAEIIYWGIGTHFGTGQSQSVIGDRLGHVVNVGGKDHKERAYRNSLPLTLHTDACDILCMLSIRRSEEGGESQYSSALAVHNAILGEKPEYLGPLYHGFRYHRFGEEGPGEEPVTEHFVPVLSERGGSVSCRYVAGYIYMAYEQLGEELPEFDREALAYFDDVALRPDCMLEFQMEQGQLLVCNNLTTLHARRGFDDPPGADQGRLLLRLWLTAHEGDRRPVDDSIEIYRTHGIKAHEGRSDTRYSGNATEILNEVLKY